MPTTIHEDESWSLADDVFVVTTMYALYTVSIILAVFVPVTSIVAGIMGVNIHVSLPVGYVIMVLAHGSVILLLRELIENREAFDQYRDALIVAGAIIIALTTMYFGVGGLMVIVSGLISVTAGLALMYILLKLTRSGVLLYAFMLVVLGVLFVGLVGVLKPLEVMQRSSGLSAMFGSGGAPARTVSYAHELIPFFALNAAFLGVELALLL